MHAFLNAVLVVNLLLAVGLLCLWARSLRQTRALQAEIKALQTASNAIPADLNRLLGDQNRRVISIEILNPVELATSKTILAKPLVGLSPAIINKLVYKEAREIIAQQLPEFGVEAVVSIHAA